MTDTQPFRPTRSSCVDGDLDNHVWQPLSFVFETQLLDDMGRYIIRRQPDIDEGRVYCVCMRCHKHTYIVTKWAGFYLSGPLDRPAEEEPDEPVVIDGWAFRRDPACVERWPECMAGEYDPRCCRFPSWCSCYLTEPAP